MKYSKIQEMRNKIKPVMYVPELPENIIIPQFVEK